MEYTRTPIVMYYGGNLPETAERPEIHEWTRRLHPMRQWAKMPNDLSGEVAEQMYDGLREKGLD